MACLLPRADELFPHEDTKWRAFLVGSELSRAVLCALVAGLTLGRLRVYALAAAVWFMGQAAIEYFARTGAEDGYSAHGPWEYVLFVVLVAVTSTTSRHE